ncbi:MAG TPA: zinc-binding dehydrogenase [Ktedonosporobacter sp.]|nr:zinc-binding dehydrogenase [Ktedonosporobacter sp.]
MRAIVIPQFGDPDVLELREVPIPQPGAGEVSIRVAYVGINFADIMIRQRGYMGAQLPFIPGYEVAGYIHAIGEGVEGLRIGQPVAAVTVKGGYAEFALASALLTFPLDQQIELATAAAFPAVGLTAYNLLVDVARLRPGESVLVHAAAGGVGTIAAQIARHLGAGQIIGTVGSQDKIAYALSAGYDHVVLRENFAQAVQEITHGKGVDVVLDSVGEPARTQSLSLLAPFGRLVVFGNAGNQPDISVTPMSLLVGSRAIMGYSITGLTQSAPHLVAETARKAFPLLANGEVRIDITTILPLEQAAEAHRLMDTRAATGKLLLRL